MKYTFFLFFTPEEYSLINPRFSKLHRGLLRGYTYMYYLPLNGKYALKIYLGVPIWYTLVDNNELASSFVS